MSRGSLQYWNRLYVGLLPLHVSSWNAKFVYSFLSGWYKGKDWRGSNFLKVKRFYYKSGQILLKRDKLASLPKDLQTRCDWIWVECQFLHGTFRRYKSNVYYTQSRINIWLSRVKNWIRVWKFRSFQTRCLRIFIPHLSWYIFILIHISMHWRYKANVAQC
jgi:hypothetical protein